MSDAITHNPNTGEELARYPQMSDEQMQAAIDRCHEAFEQWKLVSLEDRADIIRKIGEGLAANQDKLADLMTTAMGKLPSQGLEEVELFDGLCPWTADHRPSPPPPDRR